MRESCQTDPAAPMIAEGVRRPPRPDGSIKSMKKMLLVLECFSAQERRLAPSEIARRAKLPRATAHRIIQTLRQIGFLDQDRERDEYRLGLKLFQLANNAVGHTDLHRAAAPIAAALAQVTGEIAQLSVFDGTRAVVINRFLPHAGPQEPTHGETDALPAHRSAFGMAMLAWQPAQVVERSLGAGLEGAAVREVQAALQAVRACGYAVDRGALQSAWHCVAAPVRDASGQVFAALSLSAPAARLADDRLPALAALVCENAEAVSAALQR